MGQHRAEGLGESNRSGPGWIHLDHLGHHRHELHDWVSMEDFENKIVDTYEDQRP